MTKTSDVSIWPRIAVLALLAVGCGQSGSAAAVASERAAAVAAVIAACAPDSLHPVAAAPAAGLWIGARTVPRTRVAAMIGPASADGERARLTRRVETLELVAGADSIRLSTDSASVKLELLPPFQAPGSRDGAPSTGGSQPAAVYAVTPLVLLASYEPCAESAGEPRIRYLRRDARGAVATDLMLRRESAETKAALR